MAMIRNPTRNAETAVVERNARSLNDRRPPISRRAAVGRTSIVWAVIGYLAARKRVASCSTGSDGIGGRRSRSELRDRRRWRRKAVLGPDRRPTRGKRVELVDRLLPDLRRQRRIAQVGLRRLAVVEGPAGEADEGLALVRVLLVEVGEQVGVGGDRIRRRAGAVDD